MDPSQYQLRIIDVAERLRMIFGDGAERAIGRPVGLHEWRFEATVIQTGDVTTFGIGYTAAEVAESLQRQGVNG